MRRTIAAVGELWPSGRKAKKPMFRRSHLRKLQARIEKRRERAARQRKREQTRTERPR